MNKKYVISILVVVFALMLSFTAAAQTVNCTGVTPWSGGITVASGELVTYNNQEYKTLQAHTTEVGWEPPTTPALFTLIGSCGGATTPTPTATVKPTATATVTPTSTPHITATPTA